MFKLVIQDDEGKTTVVPLIRDEITIGRKEGNTIRLTERNVSRRHARIVRSNGEVQIEDLGSYNGIRVNNARIAERVSLRVSDQVQIGDYKLYLKAEGVEQVDDARTMPIERIDAPATEVMPAIAPQATQPMPAQQIPATPAPNRGPAATADTDPSGRPVATAAQVAALTQPAGYGKLCVISSNFAGKEFELTRPQMIIGRTNENDIEINHRSISRNHAKVTRDPESSRYTISDLHSSNGVRVNGQDYTKVELRKGDVVDLGHVRLRFIEPGEDWLFSRDAVIADVPETGGSKKGLWIALLVLLLGGGVAAFLMLGKKDNGGSGQNGNGGGSTIVGNQTGSSGSNELGSDNGSSGVAMVTPPDAAEVTPDDDAGRIKMECLQDAQEKKWTDVTSCADRLMALKPDEAKKLKAQAAAELKNELTVKKLDEAIGTGDLGAARKLLKDIGDDSTYHADAAKKVDDLQNKIIADFKSRADADRKGKRCGDIETLIKQAKASYGAAVADEITPYKCEAVAANPPDHGGGDHGGGDHGGGDHHAGSAAVTPPPPAQCDPKEFEDKGVAAEGAGQHALALGSYESALKCKGANVARLNKLAFMASCELKATDKARRYWSKLGPQERQSLIQMCLRAGITQDELDK